MRKVQNVKNTMLDWFLSIVAPHHCCGCGKVGGLLCSHCRNNIISEPYDVCMNCGLQAWRDGVCDRCRVDYQKAWIVGPYHETLGSIVRQVKFDAARAGLDEIARLIADRLPVLPDDVCIVPMPTIRRHIRLRGFDHTNYIARRLSRLKGLPVARRLERRHNAVQVGASRSRRRKQAREAFCLVGIIDPTLTYLLVDDVVTTGASMREAAKILRKGGARNVWAVCLAREALDGGDNI